MNCLDCGLPVLLNGDRHRTSDDVQCHRLKRWTTMANDAIAGKAELIDTSEWLNALIWHAFVHASGEDPAFDEWAKGVILNQCASTNHVAHVFTLMQHADEVILNLWGGDAYNRDSMRATLRRLAVEAALHVRLGAPDAAAGRVHDGFLVARELKGQIAAEAAL